MRANAAELSILKDIESKQWRTGWTSAPQRPKTSREEAKVTAHRLGLLDQPLVDLLVYPDCGRNQHVK